MTIREELSADLGKGISTYEQTFEWSGDNYPCVRRDLPTGDELQEAGGFVEGVSYWLVVAKASFPDFGTGVYPKYGDAVNSGRQQVKKIAGDDDAQAVHIILSIGSFDQ